AAEIIARHLVEDAKVDHAQQLLVQEDFELGIACDHAFGAQRRLHRQLTRQRRFFRTLVGSFTQDFLEHGQYSMPRKERFLVTPANSSGPRSERSMVASATENLLLGSMTTAALPWFCDEETSP